MKRKLRSPSEKARWLVDPIEKILRARDAIDARLDKVDGPLEKVDGRLDKLEVDQAYLKDKLDGVKADLSKFPPRKQLEGLRRRADKYHP